MNRAQLLTLLNKRQEEQEDTVALEENETTLHRFNQEVSSVAALRYFEASQEKLKDSYAEELSRLDAATESALQDQAEDERDTSEARLPLASPTKVHFTSAPRKQSRHVVPSAAAAIVTSEFSEAKDDDKPMLVADGHDSVEEVSDSLLSDRGFFVYSTRFRDEYSRATLDAIPQDELFQHLTKRRKLPMYVKKADRSDVPLYGSLEPIEVVDFQEPHQRLDPVTNATERDFHLDDWRLRYGSADPSIQPANVNCPACGAQFHCQDTALPGFIPAEYFVEAKKAKFKDALCRRCFLLKHHNFLLNVSVSRVDYPKMMSKLKSVENVLIVMLVDLLDFPSSIYKGLPEIIGTGKPLVVVGNKVDLLPPDCVKGYLKRFTDLLKQTVTKIGLADKMNLMKVAVVSAKTGYGIEDLITYIQSIWGVKGDIFLVGCTNSGKSTLFNALLQSDLCKVRAIDLVERATTSVWPGTTLNLLKFPVMNPTPYRLALRAARLKKGRWQLNAEQRHQAMLLNYTRDPQYAMLQGYVGRTFQPAEERENERRQLLAEGDNSNPSQTQSSEITVANDSIESLKRETKSSDEFLFDSGKGSSPLSAKGVDKETRRRWNPKHPEFALGRWCFDTPGTISKDQILNQLSLEELVLTVPKSIIVPRSFTIALGQTLFLSGLSRLDYLTGPRSILCTVFASRELPVKVVNSDDADAYWEQHAGTEKLGVPIGGKRRLAMLPPLSGRVLSFIGAGTKESAGDVILSSLGWISVTLNREEQAKVKAFTPGGVGIHVRAPSLLPFAANLRGQRIVGTAAYKLLPLHFPEFQGDKEFRTRDKQEVLWKKVNQTQRAKAEHRQLHERHFENIL